MTEPGSTPAPVATARRSLAAGDVAAARREAEAIVRDAATQAERGAAHLVLAACFQKSGDVRSALVHARSALACTPRDPLAYYACAELQEATGDALGAIATLKRALKLEPRFAQGLRFLAILLGERGDPQGALTALQKALQLDPNHAQAWNNLGNAQRALGRLGEAEQSFARAVALRPDYALAAANLGEVLRDRGEVERAEQTLRAALARTSDQPPFRPIVVLLAGLLRDRGALDEAARLYREAIALAPDKSANQWLNLGWVLSEGGEAVEARDAFARAWQSEPTDLRPLFARHLLLPRIYRDSDALRESRAGYAAGLAALERDLPAAAAGMTEANCLDGLRWSNFLLAYQGENDLALQASYADLARRVIEAGAPRWRAPVAPQAVRSGRTRIGFASAFFHRGTCGRYFESWITDLDRDRFEVFVYHVFPGMDEVTAAIARRADQFHSLGDRAHPSAIAPIIRGDELDVLVYPELGMDWTTFGLAALRLAPRQCAGWGHPVTTGHATIDTFVSCAIMEPPGAQAHYTERLAMLPGIGTRYVRPAVPSDATRRRFGLPESSTLLLCPQSLWKIHPDNDSLFAEVLAANPGTLLVLLAARHPSITAIFTRRLADALAGRGISFETRARVLPQLAHDDYLRLNLVCDVMLDTLRWSGGNTSIDAIACGLPIVTLPGEFMRGRQSAAMLELLGVPELVARDREQYLALVQRLVGDVAWRESLRERIRAAHDRLFDVRDAIEPLQQFFETGAIPA